MSKISLDAQNVRNALIEKGIETPMIDPTQAKDDVEKALQNICMK